MSDPANDFDPCLDDRISELRMILSLVQLSHPVLIQAATDLINLLRQRADRDDDDNALDEAVRVAQHALAVLAAEDGDRLGVLLEHALTLEQRFHRRADPADLDTAIDIWRALATTDVPVPQSSVAVATAQLGCLLRVRLGLLVTAAADDDAIAAALDEALRTLQAARDSLPEDAPNLADTCWLLGLCWGDRYEVERDQHQLNAAIKEIDASLRLSPDPTGDRSLALARALHERAITAWVAGGNQPTADIEADLRAATTAILDALRMIDHDDPLYPEVLWEAVSIGLTALEAAPDSVDLAAVSALTDELDAHWNAIDPQRITASAQAVLAVRARLASHAARLDPTSPTLSRR